MKLLSEREVKLNILEGAGHGRAVRAVRASDGRDYICVRDLCMALGFFNEHVSYQIAKLRRNPGLSPYYEIFPVSTPGGLQQVGFLRSDMLGPWLDGLAAKRDDVMVAIDACRDFLAREGLLVHDVSVSEGSPARPVCVYIDNSEDMIPRFAIEVIPLCAWDYLPFLFLYDLCKGWLRSENAFTRMPSRNAVTGILSDMTETDAVMKSWRVVTKGVRPYGLMDKPEPLLAQYGVVGWGEPYSRPCTAGLVRVNLSRR